MYVVIPGEQLGPGTQIKYIFWCAQEVIRIASSSGCGTETTAIVMHVIMLSVRQFDTLQQLVIQFSIHGVYIILIKNQNKH